nr:hypothetical protein [Tanacetum cinerariifolium]
MMSYGIKVVAAFNKATVELLFGADNPVVHNLVMTRRGRRACEANFEQLK